jgi:cysteine desulfurase / selenocysteine lyase
MISTHDTTVDRLRSEDYPWTATTTYLNHASIGPIPASSQRAIDAVEAKRREPGRFAPDEFFAILRAARSAAARLINADPGEIALAPNTSYGLNTAANVLPLRSGDVVLVSDGEFPANVYPWLLLGRRGVETRLVPRTAEGWPDEARILQELADPRVRAVAISMVQFASGYRADLGRLSQACRDRGVFLVVDAIQGLGQCPLDIRRTPVDLLACGAQKWLLGPWGSGFLYVRRELVPELTPAFTGWMAYRGTDDFNRLTAYDTAFQPDARRFEMVTLPYQDLAGMTASVDLLASIGIDAIAEHLLTLRAPLDAAVEQGRVALTSPADPARGSAIWCVRVPDADAVFARLRTERVVASLREGNIRLSPHAYNTVDEVARVVDLLTS